MCIIYSGRLKFQERRGHKEEGLRVGYNKCPRNPTEITSKDAEHDIMMMMIWLEEISEKDAMRNADVGGGNGLK